MADITDDTAALLRLLSAPRRIAVVGASDKPHRDSHRIFLYLKEQGHHVLPVNPAVQEVAGVAAVPDLQAAAQHWGAPPEIVDVFRAPEHLPDVVRDAAQAGARTVWCQLGVVHPKANLQALEAGLDLVVDRCILVEHQRLVQVQ